MFKVSNKEWRSSVFIVNFEHILHLFLYWIRMFSVQSLSLSYCFCTWALKKYVRSNFPMFDPPPLFLLASPCSFYMYPTPTQRTSALIISPPSSQKTFMNFRMKNRRVQREKTINFFVNSTQMINVFYTIIYTMTVKISASS